MTEQEIKTAQTKGEQANMADQTPEKNELEPVFLKIIEACGERPLKEKVSIILLAVDYIFDNHKELLKSCETSREAIINELVNKG